MLLRNWKDYATLYLMNTKEIQVKRIVRIMLLPLMHLIILASIFFGLGIFLSPLLGFGIVVAIPIITVVAFLFSAYLVYFLVPYPRPFLTAVVAGMIMANFFVILRTLGVLMLQDGITDLEINLQVILFGPVNYYILSILAYPLAYIVVSFKLQTWIKLLLLIILSTVVFSLGGVFVL
jgi:hypothetical protein